MKQELLQLIRDEDKKRPYTDDQLAENLGVRRDEITVLRNKLDIPDSRERRKPYLIQDIKEILLNDGKTTDRQLTQIINQKGYTVSRHTIAELRKSEAGPGPAEDDRKDLPEKETAEAMTPENRTNYYSTSVSFEKIIGYDGSLKTQIQQAKAAILYPPNGLHTLIIGPTGVGKSNLAESMYNFAIESGRASSKSPFIIFNCADYAENPNLLLSQLFGYVRGAFTGADTGKEGLVEKANGGILFLDEVHRLPPEGQELLYFLMDKGMYRRLGETDTVREAKVMIIAATTEDIESSLLLTFRRRIPMIIQIPPLSARPLSERYEIIKEFFYSEANRIQVKINVAEEAINKLLIYDCPGNIGQLRSDIQVACARGFLMYMGGRHEAVKIDDRCLPAHIEERSPKRDAANIEDSDLVVGDLYISPGQPETYVAHQKDLYVLPQDIYEFIESKYKELQDQGLEQEEINRLIDKKIENKFQQMIRHFGENPGAIERQNLAGIVGQNVMDIVDSMVKIVEQKIGKVGNSLFVCLAMHLSATINRIEQGKAVENPQLDNIKQHYKFEYEVAAEMVRVMEDSLGYGIPEDEIGFVAMYLRIATNPKDNVNGRIGIVVLSHGHVARGMADVANKLLGVEHAVGVEMELDEKPQIMLDRTLEVVKMADEGKGVLLLVDMGSMITFGKIITEKTGIETKTLDNVSTTMVLEAVRRAILPDTSLSEIAGSIGKNTADLGEFGTNDGNAGTDKRAIITICITGEGTAVRIKRILQKMIPGIGEYAEIIPVGFIDAEDIKPRIDTIKSKRDVLAIVGTLDPEAAGIPFISLESILSGSGINRIKQMIRPNEEKVPVKREDKGLALKDVIFNDLILVDKKYEDKNKVIDTLGYSLINHKFVGRQFLLDVYHREILSPTTIENNIAIPHGEPANVKKQAIAIAILKDPVSWEETKTARIVFMLALKEDSGRVISQLYGLIRNEEFISRLLKAHTPLEVKKIIMKFLSSGTNRAD